MLKGILIDFDNTIVNSENSRLISINYILNKFNLKITESDWNKNYKHLNTHLIFQKFKNNYDLNYEIETVYTKSHKFREEYIQKNGITFIKGFLDFYNFFKSKNIKFLICSGGQNSHIKSNLKLLNLTEIDFIGIEDFIEPKPSSACYKMGIEKLGFKKNEILVFDDSLSGIQSALNIGLKVVALNSNIEIEDKNIIFNAKDYTQLDFEKVLNCFN